MPANRVYAGDKATGQLIGLGGASYLGTCITKSGKSRRKRFTGTLREVEPQFEEWKRDINFKEEEKLEAQSTEKATTPSERLMAEEVRVIGRKLDDLCYAVMMIAEAIGDRNVEHEPIHLKHQVTNSEIEEFIAELDILEVVNMPTKHQYARFVDFCRANDAEPCTSNMLTRKIGKSLGLISVNGVFRHKQRQ